jgi:hypothetical protein
MGFSKDELDIINEPFDAKATVIYKVVQDKYSGKIKQFTGRASPYIIERLNKAFQGNWNFTIKNYESIKGWGIIAIVEIEVTTQDGSTIRKQQAAGCQYIMDGNKKSKDADGKVIEVPNINYGDTMSGAVTSALCKASSLLGIGLDAYKGELAPTETAIQNYGNTGIPQENLKEAFWKKANDLGIVNAKELSQYIEDAFETGILDPSVYGKLKKDRGGYLDVDKFDDIDFQRLTGVLDHWDAVVEAKNAQQNTDS